METWPDYLPAAELGSVRGGAPVGAGRETEMQTGRVKRRGRSAAVSAPLSFRVAPVGLAELAAFEAWFWNALERGLAPFWIVHPITGAVIKAKFPIADGYAVEELGRGAVALSVNLEVMR